MKEEYLKSQCRKDREGSFFLSLPKRRKTERGVVEREREREREFFLFLTGRRCDCTEGDCSQCVSGTERERIILLHRRKPKLTEEARE